MPTQHQKGFSLVELLVVIAIVGILAAIAIPGYRSSVLKGNRSDGYAILNEIMQAQERFAAQNDTYTTALGPLGYMDPQLSQEQYFSVTATVCQPAAAGAPVPPITACVRLVATAINGQDQDTNDLTADLSGALGAGDMTLDSRGIKIGWK